MDAEHAALLRQIRRRLTIIAIAAVTIACLVALPYALAAAGFVLALLATTNAWLIVIGAMFAAFTVMMSVPVFAGKRATPRGSEPVTSTTSAER